MAATHDDGGAPGGRGSKVSAKPAATVAAAMAAASCRSVEVVGSDAGGAAPSRSGSENRMSKAIAAAPASRSRVDQAGDGVARPRPLAVRGQAGFVDDHDGHPGADRRRRGLAYEGVAGAHDRDRASSAGRAQDGDRREQQGDGAGAPDARANGMTDADETSGP